MPSGGFREPKPWPIYKAYNLVAKDGIVLPR